MVCGLPFVVPLVAPFVVALVAPFVVPLVARIARVAHVFVLIARARGALAFEPRLGRRAGLIGARARRGCAKRGQREKQEYWSEKTGCGAHGLRSIAHSGATAGQSCES